MATPILPETQPAWMRFPQISITVSGGGYGEGEYGEGGYGVDTIVQADVPTPNWVVETLQ